MKGGPWSKPASDGSKMKVSESYGVVKTERISGSERPHSHEIVKSDHMTGRVKEVSIGPNASRK